MHLIERGSRSWCPKSILCTKKLIFKQPKSCPLVENHIVQSVKNTWINYSRIASKSWVDTDPSNVEIQFVTDGKVRCEHQRRVSCTLFPQHRTSAIPSRLQLVVDRGTQRTVHVVDCVTAFIRVYFIRRNHLQSTVNMGLLANNYYLKP